MYKTYLMHYSPLKERRAFITEQLSLKGIQDFEVIKEFDREELTEQIISEYYNQDPEAHRQSCQISMREEEYNYEKMTTSSISLNMKHIAAFNKFINQDKEFGVFLEDDCRFYSDSTSIENVITNAPSRWDVIVLGGSFDHNICTYQSRYQWKGCIYMQANHPSTNTTSSILYNKSAIPKILPHLKPFCLPIDWQLNYAFHKAKLSVWHIYPYLCTQGDFGSTANDE